MSAFIQFRKYLKTKNSYLFYLQRKILDGYVLRKSIKQKIKTYPQFANVTKDAAFLREARQYLQKNFFGYKNTNWHHYYSTMYGVKDVRFIPDEVYFTLIEPRLNRFELSSAYVDKISYGLKFGKEDMPGTFFKIMNGKFFDEDNHEIDRQDALKFLSAQQETVVVKPAIYSGGGRNIVIEEAPQAAERIKSDPEYLRGSFIIQERVKQHKVLEQFHPASLNTCRIMTARVGNEIVVLSAYLRMGNNNRRVDNGQAGGIFCRIGDDGKISDYALDKLGTRAYRHPDTGVSFANVVIPNYERAKQFCLENHRRFLRFTFISWDIGIRDDGSPVFIEFNLRLQAINGHQIINGPLFGEHTGYFIKQYQEAHKRDFYYQ